MSIRMTRRQLMSSSARAAVGLAASRFFVVESLAQPANGAYRDVFSPLDQFVEQYMRDMNAPGMTLVMADRDGVQRIATYGLSDLDRKIAVKPDDLFQIGSISKSFIANCLLQLRDEGKLDLHKPITDYLPWFRIESTFSPITTHHLLTHTAGLPSIPRVFLSDPSQKHHAAHAPGQYFHYCNMGYVALGYLLWTLDKRPLPEVIRRRVFAPLGMAQSEPVITLDVREKLAKNYYPLQNDRPLPRFGHLSEAPALIMTDAAGCIASTPRDMGLYIQMLTRRGQGPKGRLLSDESFTLFAQPHIKADEFGPTASYGYGIAVDTLDAHKILRHTGGMVSFASSMHVDLDEGVGAFASINAMQGYRPNPVAQYAIQLMRAQRAKKSLPSAPASNSPTRVENAADYAATYQGSQGRKLEIVADGQKLFLVHAGERVPLEIALGVDNGFVVLHHDFARFALVFGRTDAKDPKSAVVEAGWGSEWFAHPRYSGPRQFDYPREWDTYPGHYRNESPWTGSTHIVLRKGKLWMDGAIPLEAEAGGAFYLRDEEHSPEWIRFADVVNGKAMRIKLSGEDLWRVDAD